MTGAEGSKRQLSAAVRVSAWTVKGDRPLEDSQTLTPPKDPPRVGGPGAAQAVASGQFT